MKENAIVETTIKLIDLFFIDFLKPCDLIIREYMFKNRYIGSKDRKFISELYFSVIRSFWNLIEYLKNVRTPYNFFSNEVDSKIINGRILVATFLITNWQLLEEEPYISSNLEIKDSDVKKFNFIKIFSGEKNEPEKLTDEEFKILNEINLSFIPSDSANVGLSPFLYSELMKSFENFYDGIIELKNFQEEAPFTILVNKISGIKRSEVINELVSSNVFCSESKISDSGIYLLKRRNIKDHELFKSGKIEIQDEGSQIISKIISFIPNSKTILDYCAGAGGKTIGIINEMFEKNIEITLTDISNVRLVNANKRIKKLMSASKNKKSFPNVKIINLTEFKNSEKKFDVVVLDCPCSGVGTMRRSPDIAIKTTNYKLIEINSIQNDILKNAKKHVNVGGHIVYITCSTLIRENENIVSSFLNENKNFILKNIKEILKGTNLNFLKTENSFLKLSPTKTGTDGFFLAIMQKISEL